MATISQTIVLANYCVRTLNSHQLVIEVYLNPLKSKYVLKALSHYNIRFLFTQQIAVIWCVRMPDILGNTPFLIPANGKD